MNPCRSLRAAACFLAAACLASPNQAQQSTTAPMPAASSQRLLQQGRAAASRGDVPAARAAFAQAGQLDPGNAQPLFEAGALMAAMGSIREAEALFRRCIDLDPGSAKVHYMLGLTLIADPGTRLDWAGAIHQFRAALKLQPLYPEASARLGQGLLASNESSSAIQVLREASALSPQSGILLTQLGRAYEAAEQMPQAMDAYRRALAADPHDADAAVSLGKLLIASGHAGEAVQTLRATLRLNPDLQPAQYVLARALKQTGQTAKAAEALTASTRLSQREPDAAEAKRLSNAALQRAAEGHLAEAEDGLWQAIRLWPDYGIAHYNLGLILADQQHLLEAQYQLIQAVSLLPGQAKPLFDLGRVEQMLGNTAAAKREQQWAAQLGFPPFPLQAGPATATTTKENQTILPPLPLGWSNTVSAHQQLAADLTAVEDHLGAVGQLQRAVQLAPGRADLRLELSRELAAAGDTTGARVEASNARLIDPLTPSLP